LEAITGNKITPDSPGKAANLCGRTRALQRRLYRMRCQKPGLVKSLDFYTAIKTGFFLPGHVYNRMQEELAKISGKPGVVIEADQNDPRAYSDAQVETRIEAFIESMEPI
jgi:benzoyl-CoA reductase/2-hydroxyglutaryl-CoA dehydratase subunit BcrC/BadD/HgdB